MRTLIVHPKDKTTDFLNPIYSRIQNKTVVYGGVNKTQLRKLIEKSDRIIMLGHGSPWGLLNVGQFHMAGNYIIDYSMVELLSQKTQNVFIWCHADEFVLRHRLQGFSSGMFISEAIEAFYCGFDVCNPNLVEESNDNFASIVSRNIHHPLDDLYQNVIHQYGVVAETNPIASFNLERLYLNSNNMNYGSNRFCKKLHELP